MYKRNNLRRPLCSLLVTLLISACSHLPESSESLTQAEADRQSLSHWSELDSASDASYLNELISAPELDALIQEALAANPDLQQTLLSLKILQAQYRQTRALQLPSVDAAVSADREENSDTAYTGALAISWEMDLWAKLADESGAAARDVAEQLALYQSARDTLVAEVMQGWLKLINLRHTAAIESERVAVLEKNEQFIIQRYRAGLSTLEDLDTARSSTESARASLVAAQESLRQQQRAMNVLLGRPQGNTVVASDYPEVLLPLADLPEQTLQRRPDLKAAWLAIEAAELRTRVAYKDMLPSLSLEVALTETATSFSDALLKDPLWSLLGQLSAPLFQGGELKAAADAAELTTAQRYQAYRETLLTAVQEVEDAIGQETSLAQQEAHTRLALDSAQRTFNQYQDKYRQGLVSILDLLNVQQQLFDLEEQLDNLTYQRLNNRIALGLALGLGIEEKDPQ
ncbi:efflux transporter, outer membrane factor (OMF) lipoprotein, NodT family [Microbulbifer thermotolerans]|uniref:efflux transporter outer membrane subunit n=1 Tax=Microbulbifer thermotolerans TaxID=252514 RepID=UPI0008F2302B|nr:efflux transporter outer membrane subunit [Microbulbifer thermotolerans]SFC97725.1 efflux transporter, outer membrane factor (OMF) lipoprotein, NodT family [Microbulbifer thermotolerans]